MLVASRVQLATYLLGVCLFSVSFLVFINASTSFVITDVLNAPDNIGDAVGTLGFADELVAIFACPAWGLLSDRIGIRSVCVLGYSIIAIALCVYVLAKNIFPQLLLARLLFSVGAAAATTMVTATLPVIVSAGPPESQKTLSDPANPNNYGTLEEDDDAPNSPPPSYQTDSKPSLLERIGLSSPSSYAGIVGLFTGCGALLGLFLFLPLPISFTRGGLDARQGLMATYFLVGGVALVVAMCCFVGFRNLDRRHRNTLSALNKDQNSYHNDANNDASNDGNDAMATTAPLRRHGNHNTRFSRFTTSVAVPVRQLAKAISLGFKVPPIGLAYIGGFVARASSVGISTFIPLYVNYRFMSSGLCGGGGDGERGRGEEIHMSPNATAAAAAAAVAAAVTAADPGAIKEQCRSAYVLASKLTGTSQLIGLVLAPFVGYLSGVSRRHQLPLAGAGACGVAGYALLATTATDQLGSRDAESPTGLTPLLVASVAFIGMSHIGAVVCSLGLLGHSISQDAASAAASTEGRASEASLLGRENLQGQQGSVGPTREEGEVNGSSPVIPNSGDGDVLEAPREDDETRPLRAAESDAIPDEENSQRRRRRVLGERGRSSDEDEGGNVGERGGEGMQSFRGSIAGCYSLFGGAGILILTKLGGYLFDAESAAWPFVLLVICNAILLSAALASLVWSVFGRPDRSS